MLTLAGIVTLWHYYHPVPTEYVLIIAGTLTLILAWFLTKFLHSPRNGFTSKDTIKNRLIEELQLESLIVSEAASGIGQSPLNGGTKMGGGEFGGGGASGNF
jgi:uncharacterized membrane protein YgcG